MPILIQAQLPYASTAIATGTAAQQVQVNAAGTLAGLTAGNFVLPIPAEYPVGTTPIRLKAQGYVVKGTTSTLLLNFTWGKTIASQAAMFTAVASASLTGANPPVLPTNAYVWKMEQNIILDAVSQTASATGPGSGVSDGLGTGGIFVGAANVAITAGIPPTQLTTVPYNTTSQPSPQTGINQVVPVANSIYVGISFSNGTSETVAGAAFVITSFYAVVD